MTSKIVSLSRARKDRQRVERAAQADANAARFGRTRAERDLDTAQANKATRDLDAHRLAPGLDPESTRTTTDPYD